MATKGTSQPKPSRRTETDTVDTLLATLKHPGKPVIQALRQVILAANPRIKEGIKWNAPSFYTAEHFATFHLRAKNGVTLVLHLGAAARPDADMRSTMTSTGIAIEWKGDNRATVTFRDLAQVRRDSAAFTRLIQAWIGCVR